MPNTPILINVFIIRVSAVHLTSNATNQLLLWEYVTIPLHPSCHQQGSVAACVQKHLFHPHTNWMLINHYIHTLISMFTHLLLALFLTHACSGIHSVGKTAIIFCSSVSKLKTLRTQINQRVFICLVEK